MGTGPNGQTPSHEPDAGRMRNVSLMEPFISAAYPSTSALGNVVNAVIRATVLPLRNRIHSDRRRDRGNNGYLWTIPYGILMILHMFVPPLVNRKALTIPSMLVRASMGWIAEAENIMGSHGRSS
mgnify:CR=1 FL=1